MVDTVFKEGKESVWGFLCRIILHNLKCSLFVFFRFLRTQSLEWFYNNVKSRFKRFGSAKVLKNLYRKHRLESGACSDLIGTVELF